MMMMQSANYQALQAQALQREELAKRRSRKPMEKDLPDGIVEVVGPELVQLYAALRDLERRGDATMIRKRLDIQDAVKRNIKVCAPLKHRHTLSLSFSRAHVCTTRNATPLRLFPRMLHISFTM